ncbi:T9SS type A sorting domain-containing protein [Cytophagales bacterium RKSG123]|nr:T9SS type A sorting domain-containing protein [Xanthovirga aplysinae]
MFNEQSVAQKRGKIVKERLDLNGKPKFITFDVSKEAINSSNSQEVLKAHLEMKDNDSYRNIRKYEDKLGFVHEKFQQYHKGIKIEFGTYTVHSKNNAIQSINGDFIQVDESLSLRPSLSVKKALSYALDFIGAEEYKWEVKEKTGGETYHKPKGELVIIRNFRPTSREEEGQAVLAYKFDIFASKPFSRDNIYVNAHTGAVVLRDPVIKHTAPASGSADTRYSGSRTIDTDSYNGSYRLRDYSRGAGIITYDLNNSTSYSNAVDFTDNDNNWTAAEWDNSDEDNGALDAHWGAMMTYDYFMNVHNRDSYDGNGSVIRSYVHYGNNYENAGWDDNNLVMVYGDGASRFDVLTSLDVAAHEIGHGVCQFTADLVYSYESGALNEAFSDIWGACVENYAAPEKSIWLIGEDIDTQQEALRSLSDPKSQGDPDTYKGTNWYSGSGDFGGVHTNSGVLNHWFYMLSVGKSGTNDFGTSYNVTGIGIDKAEEIAYRTLAVYLSSSSQYNDAANYSVQSAEDIFGAGSNEVDQTIEAWKAAGINVGTPDDEYCTSQASNNNYEWIEGVTVGGFTNTSGASFYSDFTSMQIDLDAGSSYSISLDPGFASTSYPENWKIWIDLDQNKSFDSSEEVFSGSSSSTLNGNISIPSDALSGTTRMRVSMQWNGTPSSCDDFTYGEVEDYTVNVVGGASASATSSEFNFDFSDKVNDLGFLHPNPASGIVKLPYGSKGEELQLRVYSISGQVMEAVSYDKNNQELDISALSKGLYLIRVNTADGIKTEKLVIE